MSFLHQNMTLQGGRYILKQLIGSGGFANTYLAEQVTLGRKVAIKEFFMKEYCDREQTTSQVIVHTDSSRQIVERYKQKFLKEAQMIASLKNEHIIQIYDIFEENNTAYYVMEYVEGGSLKDKVEKYGAMHEETALVYIRQIAEALSYLHKHNILHLDIKPANILVNKDDKAILIDFGISKHYDSDGGQTSTTPAGVSKGYAPIEQYQQGSISGFSPSTDVYSLGATLYFLLIGEAPPEASLIYEDGLPSKVNTFSKSIQNVVATSMSPRRKDRFQTMESFLSALPTYANNYPATANGESKSIADESTIIVQDLTPKTGNKNNTDQSCKRPKEKGSNVLIVVIIVAILAILCCVVVFIGGFNSDKAVTTEVIDYSMSKILFDDGNNLKSLTFDATGQKGKTLTITKNFSDNITFSNIPDWVTATYLNNTIIIKCSENLGKVREGRVYLHRKGDGGQYAVAQVKIRQEAKPVISHNSAVLKIAETLQLSVLAARGQINWSTSNPTIATVSTNGLVTSKQKGNVTITATVDGYKLTCNVEVQQPTNTNSTYTNSSTRTNNNAYYSNKPIEISKKSATMSRGETLKLQLYNATSDFEWESDDPSIATVTSSGLVTAKSPGKVYIWAKHPGEYRKCEITVKNAATNVTQNTTRKIELSRTSATLSRGGTLKLVLYNATSDFEWESDDPSIATVTSDGLVTAKSPGKVFIWAKHTGEYRKCEITVTSY